MNATQLHRFFSLLLVLAMLFGGFNTTVAAPAQQADPAESAPECALTDSDIIEITGLKPAQVVRKGAAWDVCQWHLSPHGAAFTLPEGSAFDYTDLGLANLFAVGQSQTMTNVNEGTLRMPGNGYLALGHQRVYDEVNEFAQAAGRGKHTFVVCPDASAVALVKAHALCAELLKQWGYGASAATPAAIVPAAVVGSTCADSCGRVASNKGDAVYVKVDALNLRSGAGTEFGVLGSNLRCAALTFTGNTKGGWAEVIDLEGRVGWSNITSAFVTSAPCTSAPAAAPAASAPVTPAGTRQFPTCPSDDPAWYASNIGGNNWVTPDWEEGAWVHQGAITVSGVPNSGYVEAYGVKYTTANANAVIGQSFDGASYHCK